MMKKLKTFLCLLLILITFAAGSSSVFAAELDLKDGVYLLTEGFFTLEVTVKEKKISSIAVLEHRGHDQYLDRVRPLIDQIIADQTLDLDGISGATLSSTDLINALKQLLASQ